MFIKLTALNGTERRINFNWVVTYVPCADGTEIVYDDGAWERVKESTEEIDSVVKPSIPRVEMSKEQLIDAVRNGMSVKL